MMGVRSKKRKAAWQGRFSTLLEEGNRIQDREGKEKHTQNIEKATNMSNSGEKARKGE
jgi:hypothetical protein